MRPIKNLFFLFGLSAIGIIIGLSLIFAWKGSEPMRRLLASINTTKIIKNEYEQYQQNGPAHFWKKFRRIYSDLAESILVVDAKLENSLQTIESQANLLQGQMFDKALRRGIYDPDAQMKNMVPHRLPFNINMPQMIYNSLSNGNDTAACAILKECADSLPAAGDNPLPVLIFNMLYDMLIFLKMENPSLLNINVPNYVRGQQEELLRKQFPECFRQIGERLRSQKETSAGKLSRQVLDFITDHLQNPGLYSTMVLDHFNISQPTLQKLMRTITGRTFLVYVEQQRLAKAHELLSEGRYTVQEVASGCGFSNTNSFYKAFKRTYGFPPSNMKSGGRKL
jgi:AraC-like DNA-binding protein